MSGLAVNLGAGFSAGFQSDLCHCQYVPAVAISALDLRCHSWLAVNRVVRLAGYLSVSTSLSANSDLVRLLTFDQAINCSSPSVPAQRPHRAAGPVCR